MASTPDLVSTMATTVPPQGFGPRSSIRVGPFHLPTCLSCTTHKPPSRLEQIPSTKLPTPLELLVLDATASRPFSRAASWPPLSLIHISEPSCAISAQPSVWAAN